jgi:hypothetical protein
MAETDRERRWGEVSRAVGEELAVWRQEHPRASLSAIEEALEERWAQARAQLVQEAAEASAARDLKQAATGPAATCPACAGVVREKSWEARQLTMDGARRSAWNDRWASAPAAARSFFPLDEELDLLPGSLTPRLVASLVRLGAEIPSFERAYGVWRDLTRVSLSEATARRRTEAAGAALLELEAAEEHRLSTEAAPPAPAPALLQASVDGAMVPLVGGEWAEVRTLAVGVVGTATRRGEVVARATELSYFVRLADHETFRRQAWPELQRRGIEAAEEVVWVADGSDWCQGFADYHRPEGVRILDFPHAVEHLAEAAGATFGRGTLRLTDWLVQQRRELKAGDPAEVLAAVLGLPVETARDPAAATTARNATFEYLAKRWEQIQYPAFRARGYPIGSGAVESANKLVVEARLKGSGMHWARAHVSPLVALRAALCSGRWVQTWPRIAARLRQRAQDQAAARHQARRDRRAAPAALVPVLASPVDPPPAPAPQHPPAKKVVNGRPTADHPWRRSFLSPPRPAAS